MATKDIARNGIAEFDPLGEDFQKNPWAEFKRMRESCRAYRHQNTNMPVVSFFHHEDIMKMRLDWETWSSDRSAQSNKAGMGIGGAMVNQDPPEHTYFRQKLAPMFMPGKIGALQPTIDKYAQHYVEKALDVGKVDFLEDIAASLSTAVICTICGIPEKDWNFLRYWSIQGSINYGKGPFWKEPQPDVEELLKNLWGNLLPFVAEHIRRLRKDKTPSIMTQVQQELDDDEVATRLCTVLLLGGNDTSAHLMTNGFWELMQKPEQMQWLRENPEKMPQAVEEMVRCRPSFRRSERVATRDMVFDDVEINKGDVIYLWTASANRDPVLVPDRPDEFDIRRKPVRHQGFGAGIHMCIGNVLARLNARTLTQTMLDKTSRIQEVGEEAFQDWGNGIEDSAKCYHINLKS